MDNAGVADSPALTWRSLWTVVVVCSGLSVVGGALSALNTALADIGPDVGANTAEMAWIVDGYTLVLAAALLPMGALGDRLGRRGVLITGLALFAVASLPPIWNDDAGLLIGTRCLAGLAAAMIMPATLSLITSTLPPARRAIGVAIWAAVAGIGTVMGLFISGLLLEFFSWRSIFVAFALASVIIALVCTSIPTSRDETRKRLDLVGAGTSIGGIALLVFGLLEAAEHGWTASAVLVGLVGGLSLLAAFVAWELRVGHPLLDVRLFGNRAFAAGSFSVLLQFFVSLGLYFVTLQRMQLVFGFSALQAATATLPVVGVIALATPLGTWIALRFNLKIGLTAGTTLTGFGMLMMGYIDYDDYPSLLPMFMLVAIGMGLAAAPATTAIMVNTPAENQGVGSAVNDTSRELGAALGIALAGTIVAAGYADRIRPTTSQVADRSPEMAAHISRSLAEAMQVVARVKEIDPASADRLAHSAQQAFIGPMNTACTVMGFILLAGAVVLAVVTPKHFDQASKSSDNEESVDNATAATEPSRVN